MCALNTSWNVSSSSDSMRSKTTKYVCFLILIRFIFSKTMFDSSILKKMFRNAELIKTKRDNFFDDDEKISNAVVLNAFENFEFSFEIKKKLKFSKFFESNVKFDDEKKFWLNEIWSICLFFDWMLVLIDWSIDWLIMNFSSKSDSSSFMREILMKSKISNVVFNMNSLIICIKSISFLSYEKFSSNVTFLILIIFLWLEIQIRKIFVLL